jgi:hypothetical protein
MSMVVRAGSSWANWRANRLGGQPTTSLQRLALKRRNRGSLSGDHTHPKRQMPNFAGICRYTPIAANRLWNKGFSSSVWDSE